MPEAEFAQWQTPFEKGDIQILQTCFGNGGGYVGYPKEELLYEFDRTNHQPWGSLTIRLFHKETSTIYRVLFREVGAFRMLDEDSLLELGDKANSQILGSTVRVRNHAWSRESVIGFLNHTKDGWSWLITSENWCIEILCLGEPHIDIEKRLNPRTVPASAYNQAEINSGAPSLTDEAISSVLKDASLYREDGEKFYDAASDQAPDRQNRPQGRRVFRMER